jgi:hypothetical protein
MRSRLRAQLNARLHQAVGHAFKRRSHCFFDAQLDGGIDLCARRPLPERCQGGGGVRGAWAFTNLQMRCASLSEGETVRGVAFSHAAERSLFRKERKQRRCSSRRRAPIRR